MDSFKGENRSFTVRRVFTTNPNDREASRSNTQTCEHLLQPEQSSVIFPALRTWDRWGEKKRLVKRRRSRELFRNRGPWKEGSRGGGPFVQWQQCRLKSSGEYDDRYSKYRQPSLASGQAIPLPGESIFRICVQRKSIFVSHQGQATGTESN